MRTLAVANISEFNANNLRGTYAPSEREIWRRAGDELADMAVFWGEQDSVVLVPSGGDAEWAAATASSLDRTLQVIEPRPLTGQLVDDTLADADALGRLIEMGDLGYQLRPWGCTPSLLRLAGSLRAAGVDVDMAAPEPDALWTVAHLDSKLTLQVLAGQLDDVLVPPAQVATNPDEMLGLVRTASASGRPFVVKSHVGVSGFGTFASGAAVGQPWQDDIPRLLDAMSEEPIFREGPYLVQDWIGGDSSALRPTFDGLVTDAGVLSVGLGGMIIDGVHYRGVAVGDFPTAAALTRQAEAAGRAIGEHAQSIGFRGWFDVDFVASEDGRLYATEVNARRTSPTHAFQIFAIWSEQDPTMRCAIADDHVPVAAHSTSWKQVRPIIAEIDRRPGTRCLASIVRTLGGATPTLGAVVGATSYDRAVDALDELRSVCAV